MQSIFQCYPHQDVFNTITYINAYLGYTPKEQERGKMLQPSRPTITFDKEDVCKTDPPSFYPDFKNDSGAETEREPNAIFSLGLYVLFVIIGLVMLLFSCTLLEA